MLKNVNFSLIGFIITALVVIIYFGTFFYYIWHAEQKIIRYNCEIAEISPDIPLEVKEQCRKMRSGRI